MKILTRKQFGHPILRSKAAQLSMEEILGKPTKQLIANMFYTLDKKKYGVGLAAPQIGEDLALAIINIQPTSIRPDLPKNEWAKLIIINPKITKVFGKKAQLWEGCISFTQSFVKVPRYKKIRVTYIDEKGRAHHKNFEGLLAHVLQHEIDHLNGILFVDRVKDPSTYMTVSEYKKRIVDAGSKN